MRKGLILTTSKTYSDNPFEKLGADFMQPENETTDFAEEFARSVDPERGAGYDYTNAFVRRMLGVDAPDDEQDYTYYGLPAAGASPLTFEEYD